MASRNAVQPAHPGCGAARSTCTGSYACSTAPNWGCVRAAEGRLVMRAPALAAAALLALVMPASRFGTRRA